MKHFGASRTVKRGPSDRFGEIRSLRLFKLATLADRRGRRAAQLTCFGFFRCVSAEPCGERLAGPARRAEASLRFGIVLYDCAAEPPGRASRGVGRGALAKRFGFSQSLRVPTLTRSPTMILMNGLKALANPTRLRVLELLKNPAEFDAPRGDDGRPIGVTAKDLLRNLRCTQPTLNEQMQVLIDTGLVEARYVGRFVALHARRGAYPATEADDHRPAPAAGQPVTRRRPRPRGPARYTRTIGPE